MSKYLNSPRFELNLICAVITLSLGIYILQLQYNNPNGMFGGVIIVIISLINISYFIKDFLSLIGIRIEIKQTKV